MKTSKHNFALFLFIAQYKKKINNIKGTYRKMLPFSVVSSFDSHPDWLQKSERSEAYKAWQIPRSQNVEMVYEHIKIIYI